MKFRPLSLFCAALLGALSVRAADLTIFAAASLADALKEIAHTYEPASGDKLLFNLAASSTLARQIKEGAPADVFFSADEAKVDDMAKGGLIDPATRRSLLGNTLVIVIAVDSRLVFHSAGDLAQAEVRRLALAEPQTVPAGIYAREYLQKLGLWAALTARVVPTENVRAALAAVEAGNVEAGIVYRTDALISKKVRIALEVPAAEGPRISYPLAVLRASRNPEAARRFAAYLASADARLIFAKYGFLPAP